MNRAAINAAKRARYADDEATREYYKTQAKQYRINNPGRRRQAEIQNRYGLTVNQYDALLESQNNACAICLSVFTKTPHVDHCHATQRVRGLLCTHCNMAIGLFQDEVGKLSRAIAYLSGQTQ